MAPGWQVWYISRAVIAEEKWHHVHFKWFLQASPLSRCHQFWIWLVKRNAGLIYCSEDERTPSLNLNRDVQLSPSFSFPGKNWFASATVEREKQQKRGKYVRANVDACYFHKTEFLEPFSKTSARTLWLRLLHHSCTNAYEYKEPEPKLTLSSGWLWLLGYFIIRSRS